MSGKDVEPQQAHSKARKEFRCAEPRWVLFSAEQRVADPNQTPSWAAGAHG